MIQFLKVNKKVPGEYSCSSHSLLSQFAVYTLFHHMAYNHALKQSYDYYFEMKALLLVNLNIIFFYKHFAKQHTVVVPGEVGTLIWLLEHQWPSYHVPGKLTAILVR